MPYIAPTAGIPSTTIVLITGLLTLLFVVLMVMAVNVVRRRTRLQRAAKWIGAVTGVLLIGIAITNLWCSAVAAIPNGFGVGVGGGTIAISFGYWTGPYTGFAVFEAMDWDMWLPAYQGGIIAIPIWLPLLVLTVLTYGIWWPDSLPRPDRCRCGYNLSGNVSGVCPECGRGIECRCDSLSELNGKQADDYADGHLEARQIGSKVFYVCPETEARWEMEMPQGEFHGESPTRLRRISDSADQMEPTGY